MSPSDIGNSSSTAVTAMRALSSRLAPSAASSAGRPPTVSAPGSRGERTCATARAPPAAPGRRARAGRPAVVDRQPRCDRRTCRGVRARRRRQAFQAVEAQLEARGKPSNAVSSASRRERASSATRWSLDRRCAAASGRARREASRSAASRRRPPRSSDVDDARVEDQQQPRVEWRAMQHRGGAAFAFAEELEQARRLHLFHRPGSARLAKGRERLPERSTRTVRGRRRAPASARSRGRDDRAAGLAARARAAAPSRSSIDMAQAASLIGSSGALAPGRRWFRSRPCRSSDAPWRGSSCARIPPPPAAWRRS